VRLDPDKAVALVAAARAVLASSVSDVRIAETLFGLFGGHPTPARPAPKDKTARERQQRRRERMRDPDRDVTRDQHRDKHRDITVEGADSRPPRAHALEDLSLLSGSSAEGEKSREEISPRPSDGPPVASTVTNAVTRTVTESVTSAAVTSKPKRTRRAPAPTDHPCPDIDDPDLDAWLTARRIPTTKDPVYGHEVEIFIGWHGTHNTKTSKWANTWATWRGRAENEGRLPPRRSNNLQAEIDAEARKASARLKAERGVPANDQSILDFAAGEPE
jgi:hypothetical protein